MTEEVLVSLGRILGVFRIPKPNDECVASVVAFFGSGNRKWKL